MYKNLINVMFFTVKFSVFKMILFLMYESWNFNSGNYLFTTDTK